MPLVLPLARRFPLPVHTTLSSLRAWRSLAHEQRKSVGFVPTMGALHDGHLSLVRRSLQENDLTIVSIFVNPTQFAPHEDLSTYPRTLDSDLQLLSSLFVVPPSQHPQPQPQLQSQPQSQSQPRTVAAVFAPTPEVMYPSGYSSAQGTSTSTGSGTIVDLPSLSQQLEGLSRPHFFRGVSTICTKLFNAVLPHRAYFGQKDIQQALVIRRMCRDLLVQYPEEREVHVVPTARAGDGLALSSRNAYLTPPERALAPHLYQALLAVRDEWTRNPTREVLGVFEGRMQDLGRRAQEEDVSVRLDYVELSWGDTLDPYEGPREGVVPPNLGQGGQGVREREGEQSLEVQGGAPVILSAALWVGKTRLIDNVILGDDRGIVY
ncbi:Nucleotidylyl transferase [Dacryopinax primogenitus]|uniref:Pantoate--beta-alanine ligase n=1 Tax=Dacryopinax primogenitus (strain DJM 731) TaxID=1858805 RepID=M5FQF4_DACPD|nr:Nucleotidylyl transferase [Dacryopinax primogenitus]EJT99115.1 Nucleotidylyl transferase [Dacryopinax primogenitus]